MTSGRWAGSDRKARLPSDWDERRAFALRRDGWRCCAMTAYGRCAQIATDVDHVQRGDDHSYANLQSLCAEHHRIKTAAEAVEARREKYTTPRRPPERHPLDL